MFSHVVVIFVYLFVDWLLLVLRSSEASRYLVEVLESVSHSELDDIIERVLDAVEKQPCECSTACCVLPCEFFQTVTVLIFRAVSSSMIEMSVVESAVQDCTQTCDETM